MGDPRSVVIANLDSCIAALEEYLEQRIVELAAAGASLSTPEEVIAGDEELQSMREALECLMALRRKVVAGATSRLKS
jgi:hypothetical protein